MTAARRTLLGRPGHPPAALALLALLAILCPAAASAEEPYELRLTVSLGGDLLLEPAPTPVFGLGSGASVSVQAQTDAALNPHSTTHPAPVSGVIRVEPIELPKEPWIALRAQMRADASAGLVGLAVVFDEHTWLLAGTVPDGEGPRVDLSRSKGEWKWVERGAAMRPGSDWFWLELVAETSADERTWSVYAWTEGERPEVPALRALEDLDPSYETVRPGAWVAGDGLRQAADLQMVTGEADDLLGPDGRVRVPIPGDSEAALTEEEPPAATPDPPVAVPDPPEGDRGRADTKTLVGCFEYLRRYDGYAPAHPGSWANLGLPPEDRDCDGVGDPWPGGWNQLSWESEDGLLARVELIDRPALLVVILRVWPSISVTIGFITADTEFEWAAGWVREDVSGRRGVAAAGRNLAWVEYTLFPAAAEPLAVEILESGVPVADGQWFGREVSFTARTTGGEPPVTVTATIDGVPYDLGTTIADEGEHLVEVTAVDAGSDPAYASATFGVDLTPPLLSDLLPAAGSVLNTPAVTVSGLVSADATSVTVAGAPADLGDPDGAWRPFTSPQVDLVEGGNTIPILARDRVEHETPANHTLVLDTTPPVLTVDTPADGQITADESITVSGTVTDPHLATVTVNGLPATVSGGVYSADVALGEGDNPIVVIATDVVHNPATKPITVFRDSVDPDLTVLESGVPATGDLLLNRAAVFTADADDATAVTLDAWIDGSDYVLGGSYDSAGAHLLAVTATDQALNETTVEVVFTIDLHPPLVEFTSPLPGAVVDATPIDVLGRTSADTDELTVGTVAAALGPPAGDWRAFTAAEVPLELEGINALQVTARDLAGNPVDLQLEVHLDTADPVLELVAPEPDLVTNVATLVVSGVATDPHLDGVTVNDVDVTVGADGAFSHTITLAEGENTVVVEAVDVVGHETSRTRSPVLDTVPPVITVTADGAHLVDGLLVNQAITPEVAVDDATEVVTTIELNGELFASGTLVEAEGSYLLRVEATDAAGNHSELGRSFTIDATPPALAGLQPADGTVTSNPAPDLSGSCDDAATVTIDGQPATVTAGAFTFAGLALAEGDNAVLVEATDAAGNLNALTLHLVLDTILPQLAITAPDDGAVTGDTRITVSGTVTDANPDTVDVAGYPASLAGDSFQVQVPLAHDGVTTLAITATDRAGNSGSETLTVERDTAPPDLVVTRPGPSAIVAERTVAVEGTAADPHLDGLTVNGEAVIPGPDGAFATTVSLPEGGHTVIVEAWDTLGNRATVERAITIDLSAPVVHITAPAAGAVLAASTVTVTGTVSDGDAIDRVTVNGVDATVAADGAWTLDGLELAEGPNTLIARAWDAAGNTGTASVDIVSDTVAPEITAVVPAPGTTGVPPSVRLRVVFSEPVDPATLDGAVTLTADDTPLALVVEPDAGGAAVLISVAGGMAADREHTLAVSTAVADRAGHTLAAAWTSTFTTADTEPPAEPQVDPAPPVACFSTLSLTGSAEPGVTVEGRGDVTPHAVTAAADGAFALDLSPTVAAGAVQVFVTAVDASGNRSSGVPVVVELDCAPPAVATSSWDGDRVVTAHYTETLDPATAVAGDSVLLDGAFGPLPFTVAVTGDTVTAELAATPPPDELPLRLELATAITDPAGNPALPYTRLFVDPAAATMVAGEVFDDSTSLPITGARAVLVEDGGPMTDVEVTTDGRGRFSLPVSSSPVTVRLEADGFLPAWRRVVPVPGASTLLFDARLVAASPSQTLTGGGSLQTGTAELVVDAASLPPDGLDVALTALSEQGLPGLLPLGWTPVAAVHVEVAAALDPPAVLRFTVTLPADAVIVSWSDSGWRWIAEAYESTFDVTASGAWAVVVPDPAPTLPGDPVLGSPLPAAAAADPGELLATLDLDPAVIQPFGRATATVTVTPAVIVPSGLPVEARLDEVLHVVDGRVVIQPPDTTDLVLYRRDASTMSAIFAIGASDSARRLPLDEGRKQVHIRALPDEVRVESLVGPAGGTILTADGLGLEVLAGALDRTVGVNLDLFPLANLPLDLPSGLEAVAAAELGLGGATLAVPAVLGFPVSAQPEDQHLLLTPVEVDGATVWRLVGVGAAAGDRVACGPDALPGLPAPWVRSGGVYVLVRPVADAWGLLSGEVLDTAGSPADPCRVDAGDLVQLTAADGSYAQAAPAGAVTVTAEHLVRRNAGTSSTSVTSAEHVTGVDIALLVVAPTVVATSPADQADSVPAATAVQVDLSEPLDPVTVTGDSVVVQVIVGTAASQPWPGAVDLSGDGTRLTYEADQPFPSASEVSVTVRATVRDLQGYPLNAALDPVGVDHALSFSVERVLLPDDVDPSRIRLYAPGHDPMNPDQAVVEGDVGAVPGNVWLWVEKPMGDAGTTSFQAGADGSFSQLLTIWNGTYGVVVGEPLILHLLISDEPGDDLGVVPLRPWLTPDGVGASFTVDGGTFTTADNITVTVPAGALPDGSAVRAVPADPAVVLPAGHVPGFCATRAAMTLELSTDAARTLQLVIPGQPPADQESTMLVARLIPIAGRDWPMLVRTAAWDQVLQAYVTTPVDDAKDLDDPLAKAVADGLPDAVLPGLVSSANLVVLEPLASAKSSGEVITPAADLGLVAEAGGVSVTMRALIADLVGDFAYLNFLYVPGTAAVTADSGWAVDLHYHPMPVHGATVPIPGGDPLTLRVVDPDTGWTHWEGSYPPPTGDWVDLDDLNAPGMPGTRLEVVGGDPVQVYAFEAVPGEVPLAMGIDVSFDVDSGLLVCSVADGALPTATRLRLYNLRDGQSGSGSAPADLTVTADLGDPILLAVEGVLDAADQPVRVRFSKVVENLLIDRDVTATEVGGGEVAIEVAPAGQVVVARPARAWSMGERYDVSLAVRLFETLGSGQEFINDTPVVLPLRAAEAVAAPPVVPAGTTVADAVLAGDLLLVAARDAGLQVWDVSDPASPGRPPLVTALQTSAVAAVAHDGFGHVLAMTGRVHEHAAVRLLLLDELREGEPGPAEGHASFQVGDVVASVGPGDLELEVEALDELFTAAAPAAGVTAVDGDDDGDWDTLTVAAQLLTPYHPVRLHDSVSGRVLWSGAAPESGDLVITNDHGLTWTHPLRLRALRHTTVWGFSLGGAMVAASLEITESEISLQPAAAIANPALRDWLRTMGPGQACRIPGSEDLVFLGRLALARLDPSGDGPRGVLLSASRHDGLYGFVQTGTALTADPTWIQCLRSADGDTLSDVATARWRLDGNDEEISLAAVVGHRRLEVLEIGADGRPLLPALAADDLGWAPFRVAVDPVNRLILVRDNDAHLAVYSLTRRPEADDDGLRRPDLVADIVLPDGAGMGPLVVDPESGLAFTGTAPVQYTPPSVGLVADADNDGLPEQVDYLQPLGAPEAPVTADGRRPPHLAWVYAHVAGVPDGTDTLVARIAGLGPGGAPLPVRPEPFLPSSTLVELTRTPGLPLDDPGRHYFVSERPILLVADERARSEYWQAVEQDPTELERLTHDPGNGAYPVCRNCDRDIDDDGTPDLPWGEPAPHPDPLTVAAGPGDAPWELAAAATVRVTLETDDPGGSAWLDALEDTDLLPDAEAVSVAWMGSPPAGRDPGIESRSGLVPQVELATGALDLARTDLVLPAPGLDLAVVRIYTSGGIVWGDLGWGWSLAGVDRLRPNPDKTVDLVTATGDRFVFGSSDHGHPGATFFTLTAWGHPGELQRMRGGGWLLLEPDGMSTEFNGAGYPAVVRDRHRLKASAGSELRYMWSADGSLLHIGQANGTGSHATKPRWVRFERDASGLVTAATDSTGRTFTYDHDTAGRLETVTSPEVRLSHLAKAMQAITEHYTPAAMPGNPVAALDTGGAIEEVRDGEDRLVLDPTWDDTVTFANRVTTLAVGELESSVAYGDHQATVSDADGVTEALTWDDLGRVTELNRGGIQTTTMSYVDGIRDSLVDVITLPAGARLEHTWEAEGSPTSRLKWFNLNRRVRTRDTVTDPPPFDFGSTLEPLEWAYEYDSYAQPTKITLPGTGREWNIARERGEPRLVFDPEGRETQFWIDSLGRRTAAIDGLSNTTSYSYDDTGTGCGEVKTIDGPYAIDDTTTITYDEHGFPEQIESPPSDTAGTASVRHVVSNDLGWVLEQWVDRYPGEGIPLLGYLRRQYTYDGAGRVHVEQHHTEEGDVVVTHETTDAGLPLFDEIAGGPGELVRTTYQHTSAGRMEEVSQTPTGRRTTFDYDALGRVRDRSTWATSATTNWLSTTYTYARPDDQPTLIDLPGDDHVILGYDQLGRQVLTEDALGRVTLSEPDAAGRVVERTVLHGSDPILEEGFTYNNADQTLTQTVTRTLAGASSHTATTTYQYNDPRGLLTMVTDAEDRESRFAYDEAGRQSEAEMADGTAIATTYWGSGLASVVTEVPGDGPSLYSTYSEYNEAGLLSISRSPGGNVTHFGYGKGGRPLFRDAPEGQLTTWTTSPLGTTSSVRQSGRATQETFLDLSVRTLSRTELTTDAVFQASYDEAGRVIDQYLAGGISRHLRWNDDGTLDGIDLAGGTSIQHAYDAGNRLRSITVTPDGGPGWPTAVGFDYDLLDNLTFANDDQGVEITRSVWNTGEVAEETLLVDGVHAFSTAASYDDTGLLEALTYPDGTVVSSGRDSLGRLQGVSVDGAPLWSQTWGGLRPHSGTTGALSVTRTYTAEGMPEKVLAAIDHGAGASSQRFQLQRQYNDVNRFTSQNVTSTFDATSILNHDPAQRVSDDPTSRASAWRSDRAGLPGVGGALGWSPPASERASRTFGGGGTLDDLTSTTLVTGGVSLDQLLITDPTSHRLTGTSFWSFDYDALGNRTQAVSDAETRTFAHDWSNRLLEVLSDPGTGTAGTLARFRYDPLGRRVVSTETDTTTIRVPWAEQVVAEYILEADDTTTLRKRTYWGDATDHLLAYDWDADLDGTLEARLHPLTDPQGTVQAVADPDGTVVESYVYRPDGSFLLFGVDTTAPELILGRVRPADPAAGREFQSLELVFTEPVQLGGGTAELRDSDGQPLFENWHRSADNRRWSLDLDPPLTETVTHTLYVQNLEDMAGNHLATPVDLDFTAPADTDEHILQIDGEGALLAIIDGPDAIALVAGAPIDPTTVPSSSVTVRSVGPDPLTISGTLTLLDTSTADPDTATTYDSRILLWTPDDSAAYALATYDLVLDLHLTDPAGHPIHGPPDGTLGLPHLGESDIVWAKPSESPLLSASQVGNDRFLHGRPYVETVGLYDHRARWYEPATQVFLQIDPLGPVDSPNLYQAFGFDAFNVTDPFGTAVSRSRSGTYVITYEQGNTPPRYFTPEQIAENPEVFRVALVMGGMSYSDATETARAFGQIDAIPESGGGGQRWKELEGKPVPGGGAQGRIFSSPKQATGFYSLGGGVNLPMTRVDRTWGHHTKEFVDKVLDPSGPGPKMILGAILTPALLEEGLLGAAPGRGAAARWSRTTTPWQRRVYRRGDIDWDLVRPEGASMGGRTNLEAASEGLAPVRLNPNTGRGFEDVILHHANQNPRGAAVEVWRTSHGRVPHRMDPPGAWRNTELGRRWANAWNAEQSAYWKWRVNAINPPPTALLYLPGDPGYTGRY